MGYIKKLDGLALFFLLTENTIFLLLGNVLSWNSQKEDLALARTAMQMAGVKGKPPGVVKESCIICMAGILVHLAHRNSSYHS